VTPQFDAYMVVDWSANATPKRGRDSIWVGFGRWKDRRLHVLPSANPLTRTAASEDIQRRLETLVDEGARVFVGFDFPYAYPGGLARALGWRPGDAASSSPWRFTWDRLGSIIRDAPDNSTNRFEAASSLNAAISVSPGPFWGGPPRCVTADFESTSPVFPFMTLTGATLARHRLAELAMRRRGQQVQETWKLLGRGSVGSQSLTGIPRVAALRGSPRLAAHSRIWPMETDWIARLDPEERPFVLHAEIWPRVAPFVACATKVRDEIQVECLVRWLAEKDAAGELARLLDAPAGLTDAELEACLNEEGWIVGA
jgi:precorrin-8X/cobalt-precorrin-8 methylmutase